MNRMVTTRKDWRTSGKDRSRAPRLSQSRRIVARRKPTNCYRKHTEKIPLGSPEGKGGRETHRPDTDADSVKPTFNELGYRTIPGMHVWEGVCKRKRIENPHYKVEMR